MDHHGNLDKADIGELKRIVESECRRGYPSYWHASNDFQDSMEVFATRCWANELNKRGHSINIYTIEKNNQTVFPDCLADMNGLRTGIEVTELTVGEKDRNRYAKATKKPHLNVYLASGVGHDDRTKKLLAKRKPLETPVPNTGDWPFAAFEEKLKERVETKENTAKEHAKKGSLVSLHRLVLLIVTDEPNLWTERLRDYLKGIRLPGSNCFHHIYVMTSPQPNDQGGDGHCPVFEVNLGRSTWSPPPTPQTIPDPDSTLLAVETPD